MTYRSKTSRTKKRSSDARWSVAAVAIAFLGLFVPLAFGFRAISVQATYGVIPAEIPVVPAEVQDPSYHTYAEKADAELSKHTPAVVLTREAFYFGDLSAFTASFANPRDKFVIRHVDGEPQLFALIETMQKWADDRAQKDKIPLRKEMVLLPEGSIPMPIVIQVIAGLRKSALAERVVLAAGLF